MGHSAGNAVHERGVFGSSWPFGILNPPSAMGELELDESLVYCRLTDKGRDRGEVAVHLY